MMGPLRQLEHLRMMEVTVVVMVMTMTMMITIKLEFARAAKMLLL